MMKAEGPGALVRIWSANPVGTLRIYVDGNVAKCSSISGLIPTGGDKGTRLVDNLTAFIDDVRIYARALPADDICTHANKSDCDSECD